MRTSQIETLCFPTENWYNGEIGFYDNYVIPLAKKLKDCGVFGVSSDEYLNYAEQNRRQWQDQGKRIVAGYRSAVEDLLKESEEKMPNEDASAKLRKKN